MEVDFLNNFYNDDIILTKEMTKNLLASLTRCDEEYLEARNRYK